jgi:hypothetical protein
MKQLALAALAIVSASGCGEIDIRAIDRSKATVPEAGPLVDAAADAVQEGDAVADAAETGSPYGIYLEAESGRLSGGFTVGNDPTASGGQFLAPPAGGMPFNDQPGPARSIYDLNITFPGTYTIWGRIQSPDTLHNRFWVQVDGESWYHWYITTGEIWYWNRVHNNVDYYTRITFDLSVGPHQIHIANSTDGVRLDRLYITPDRDVPPGNDTPCRPPDSIQVNGACIPSCGSQGGNQCGVPQCMGARMVSVTVYDCQVCCIVP